MRYNHKITISLSVLIGVSIAISILTFANSNVIVMPLSILEAMAVKHSAFNIASPAHSVSKEVLGSNVVSPSECINYNSSVKAIIVSCSKPTTLTDIADKLSNNGILITLKLD